MDRWAACGFKRVPTAEIEELRVRLERVIHRRHDLDAWMSEAEVWRAVRRGRVHLTREPARER